MDITNYIIPKENASDTSVQITDVHVNSKSKVSKGDLVFEFETSKANFEVESEYDSYIYHNLEIGQKINVGEIAFSYYFYENQIQLIESNKEISVKHDVQITKKAKLLIEELKIEINDVYEIFSDKIIITENDIKNSFINKNSYEPGSMVFKENDIVVYGTGGHSLQCIEILNLSKYNIMGFVSNHSIEGFNHSIIGSEVEDIFLMQKDGLKNIVLAFGSLNDLNLRNNIYEKLKVKGLNFPNLISPQSNVSILTTIEDDCGIQIFQGATIGPSVKIKENVVINSNATISHHCELDQGCHIAPGAILAGNVKIGKSTLIGMGACLFMKVEIDKNKVIPNLSNILK